MPPTATLPVDWVWRQRWLLAGQGRPPGAESRTPALRGRSDETDYKGWRLPRYPIDAVDPDGRRIRCNRYWWVEHVLTPRPFFYGMHEEVEATIRDPDTITEAQLGRGRRRLGYYRKAPDPYSTEMIKLVVEVARLGRQGKVITAMLTRDIPPPERNKVVRNRPS